MTTSALNAVMEPGNLDRRITIQSKQVTRDTSLGSESVAWVTLATVWAQVLEYAADSEGLTGSGLTTGSAYTSKQAIRIRMRYRSDVTTAMRVLYGTRVVQITGVAELGRKVGLELAAQDWSSE